MSPIAPLPAGQPGAAFGQLVETAITEPSRTLQPGWILRSGELAPQTLCRYAAGQVTQSERAGVQELILRHDWARGRVTALVKAGRSESGLGAAILGAARSGEVDPYRLAALDALRELGEGDAADALDRNDRAAYESVELTGAAKLLGQVALGEDRDQARAALSAHSLEDAGPQASLAWRVAALDDEDEALVALLEAVSPE